jgi:hypothetical protein
MQTKSTLRFHLTPVKMAIIKNTNNDKCWHHVRKKGTLIYCWWECKLVQLLWKTVWRFLNKHKTELLYDSVITLLGLYLRNISQDTIKTLAHPHLLQHYGNSPDALQLMNELRNMIHMYTHTHRNIIQS